MHLCSVSGNIAAQYVSTYLQLSLQFPFKITRCVIPPFRFSAYFLRDGLRSFSKIKSDWAILVQVKTKSKRDLVMKFFCFLWMLSVWAIRVSYKTNRYLDQLGMASTFDTKTYCRQSLIGGNYGLLNTTTFVPNPDYYRLFNFEVFTLDRPKKLCFVALLAIAFTFVSFSCPMRIWSLITSWISCSGSSSFSVLRFCRKSGGELRSGSMSGEKLDFSEFSKIVVAQNETQTVCGLVLFSFLITRKKKKKENKTTEVNSK